MFTLSEDHTMLRDAARAFITDKAATTHLRALRDGANAEGFDRALYAEMAAMGWCGVIIPEAYGGAGLDYRGLGLVLEEAGRTLAPSPLLSSALIGASAILLGGNEAQKKQWLPKIADGTLITALAIDESAHHAPEKTALRAKKTASGYVLNGAKTYVADGHVADLLIVAARADAGLMVFLVPADAPGVARTPLNTIDSRGAADIAFNDVAIGDGDELHAPDRTGEAFLDMILDRARIGLAAEMLGTASQAFETTAEYLKTRTQFGQLIGSFQGLQHRAAKMLTDLELTKSCVMAALSALDENRADVSEYASLAKARTGDTLHVISNEMVQMHGGIGMTDAADPGLYLKRARVAEALYGSASYHRDRYARLSGF
jgi:alkylation response protein AidB-like acyl-CoA dehydrogenase